MNGNPRRARTLTGAAVATFVAAIGAYLHPGSLAALCVAPLVGAAIVLLDDMRSRRRTEVRDAEHLRGAIEALTRESDAARREFASLTARQRELLAQAERDLCERSARLRRAFMSVDGRHVDGEERLRAVSHDLAMPLMVLKTNLFSLRDTLDAGAPVDAGLVKEQLNSVARVERLLAELAQVAATEDASTHPIAPSRVEVTELAQRLSRRLSAFALGRAIQLSVEVREQCPTTLYTDVVLLDRVLDNLLSNAVKYTVEGSVSIVLGGATACKSA